MGIRSVFEEAIPVLFNKAGEDAIFTPAVGDPIPCKIDINFGVELQPVGAESQIWERGVTIEALLSVLTREPARGETFTYPAEGGVVYTVQAVLENDDLTVTVQVK